MSTITGSKFLVVSHDFPVVFQVFRNIHEYANEVIYIYEHWMKKIVKLHHL